MKSELGFGTMEHVDGSKKPEAMYDAVCKAIEAGYRHFDTAETYQTQEFVGKAIKASKITRTEFFVTTKLRGMPSEEFQVVRTRTASMLERMGLDRFDLLLMHWPGPSTADLEGEPDHLAKTCDFQWFLQNLQPAWKNMIQLQKEGLAMRIGVSNFYASHMEELLRQFPAHPPFANQIYIDALNQEREFVAAIQRNNIVVIAYRPIAFIPVYEMAANMGDLTFSVLSQAAEACGCCSIQQFVLAWLMQRGIWVVPKSANPTNIQTNFEASAKISALPRHPGFLAELDNGSETVALCGGRDEYALAWRRVSEEAHRGTE